MPWYGLGANLVALLHAAYIGFVVCGMATIVYGLIRKRAWARSPWLRIGHLAMIAIVVVQAWLGVVCPLTALEKSLRSRAGEVGVYQSDFIEHWVHRLIFFNLPPWVFLTAYSLFGLGVLATFLLAPPRFGAELDKNMKRNK